MRKSLLIVLFLFLTGCANIAKVSNIDTYETSGSYLYGTLKLARENISAASMALEFQNLDTSKSYLVKFDTDGEPFTLQVEPGTYMITRFHALGAFNAANGAKVIDDHPYGTKFEVNPGEAIYIGEHLGTFKIVYSTMRWSVEIMEDQYDFRTTTLGKENITFENIKKRRAFEAKSE